MENSEKPLYRVLGYADNPFIESALARHALSVETHFRRIAAVADPGGVFSRILASDDRAGFFRLPDVSSIVSSGRISGWEKDGLKFLVRAALAFLDGRRIEESDRIVVDPGGIPVSPVDGNPFNSFDAHPDNRKDGIGVGWGALGSEEWKKTYSEAFRLLQSADLGFYEEIRRFLLKIVPLGTDDRAHRSASYAEAFGCVYMGLTTGEKHPEHSVLEGLIHEWSHNKANLAISTKGPLLANDRREAYYSAYRPDPRPVIGIFLGFHAFAPTVRVFLEAFEFGAILPEIRIEKTFSMHAKNRRALEVVSKYGSFTEEGAEFFEETRAVHEGNERMIEKYRERFPRAYDSAAALSEAHFAKAKAECPGLMW